MNNWLWNSINRDREYVRQWLTNNINKIKLIGTQPYRYELTNLEYFISRLDIWDVILIHNTDKKNLNSINFIVTNGTDLYMHIRARIE